TGKTYSNGPQTNGSHMSKSQNSKRESRERCRTLSILPVSRLSTATTLFPSANRASQRCDPRKPAPPVTSTGILRSYFVTNQRETHSGFPGMAPSYLDCSPLALPGPKEFSGRCEPSS